MKRTAPQYVMCVFNEPNQVSLQLRRIYRTIPDEQAARLGMLRVIDEEEEDYLYPKEWFVSVRLPAKGTSAFKSPSDALPPGARRSRRRTTRV